jgi:hypothetical protein
LGNVGHQFLYSFHGEKVGGLLEVPLAEWTVAPVVEVQLLGYGSLHLIVHLFLGVGAH